MKKTFKHIITIFSFLLIFITNISIANATVLSNFNNDYYLETVITDANPTFSFSTLQSNSHTMNIPDEIPSAVRRYGNHFLASLLCIPKYNFYENISKGCYAPQMRQGLD